MVQHNTSVDTGKSGKGMQEQVKTFKIKSNKAKQKNAKTNKSLKIYRHGQK